MNDGDSILPVEAAVYYGAAREIERLQRPEGRLEMARTQELVQRYLPPPPARILDAGGGTGPYAAWLAREGYDVHLIDAFPLHVEQARAVAATQPDRPFTAALGDARSLDAADASVHGILLLGPLYHLTERHDRLRALGEVRRVLRPGGYVFGAAISRFASLLEGVWVERLEDPLFAAIVAEDLRSGRHRNPGERFGWFTTSYFHRVEELADEVREAGLVLDGVFGVEGPGYLLPDLEERWANEQRRRHIMQAARLVEREPALMGMSAHLLAVAHKDSTQA